MRRFDCIPYGAIPRKPLLLCNYKRVCGKDIFMAERKFFDELFKFCDECQVAQPFYMIISDCIDWRDTNNVYIQDGCDCHNLIKVCDRFGIKCDAYRLRLASGEKRLLRCLAVRDIGVDGKCEKHINILCPILPQHCRCIDKCKDHCKDGVVFNDCCDPCIDVPCNFNCDYPVGDYDGNYYDGDYKHDGYDGNYYGEDYPYVK